MELLTNISTLDPMSGCTSCGTSPERDHHVWNFRARGETPSQRVDRGYLELLQEVRVSQTGVQIVLAFLLWLAYSPAFRDLGTSWKVLYIVGLISGLAAAACLIAPACCHRLVYGRRVKAQLFALANRLIITGLACLLIAVGCVLGLVIGPIAGGPVGAVISASILVLFGSIWYGPPMLLRARRRIECMDCAEAT